MLDFAELGKGILNFFLRCVVVDAANIYFAGFHDLSKRSEKNSRFLMDYDFHLVERLLEIREQKANEVISPVIVPDLVVVESVRVGKKRSRSRSRTRHEYSRMRENEEDKRKDLERSSRHEKSKREDCSIMVMGVHHEAGDRDVYEFFSKEAGKVRDVSVIRDSRTGKSKGVAYVEFYLQESVIKALGCNGRTIKGFAIRVQASGAEKNRAAEAQKFAHVKLQQRPVMLYIMGLSGKLSEITEAELRSLFTPFGEIDLCEIGKCPYTYKNRGFAHVQFSRTVDAREAMACLNDFEIAGEHLQVGYLASSLENLDDEYTEKR